MGLDVNRPIYTHRKNIIDKVQGKTSIFIKLVDKSVLEFCLGPDKNRCPVSMQRDALAL